MAWLHITGYASSNDSVAWQNICGISVVKDFEKYRKFNLRELQAAVASTDDTKPAKVETKVESKQDASGASEAAHKGSDRKGSDRKEEEGDAAPATLESEVPLELNKQ